MNSKNQELIFSGIVFILVVRNSLKPEKNPFDWVMILIGIGLLARQGYAVYQSQQR
jgi:hypothetical protein